MKNSVLHVRNLLLMLCVLAMTACGFHLRGTADLSFKTLYINKAAAPALTAELARSFKFNGVKVTGIAEQADLQLEIMGERYEKRILSLSGGGKVSEYTLLYHVTFRTRTASTDPWDAPQTIDQMRDYSYDNTLLLAKEGEEARLNNDMRSDAAREIIRRLSAQQHSKPSAAD